VRYERTEVILAVDDARHHVSDKERLGALAPGIIQRGMDGFHSNLADGFIPLLVNFSLADPDDGDWSHREPRFLTTKENVVYWMLCLDFTR